MKSTLASGIIAAAVLATALAPVESRAGVIYDDTTTVSTGLLSFTALPIGNEVKAGGTDRTVTELEVGLSSQRIASTLSTLQAFLYANDGAGGAPGTLLWQSAVMTSLSMTGGNDLVAFAVPNVIVPDTFTWAVQVGPSSPVATGLPGFGSPTVGSEVNSWFGGPGLWTLLKAGPIYEARITATATAGVPEPATATMVGVFGMLVLVGARLRRHRLAA